MTTQRKSIPFVSSDAVAPMPGCPLPPGASALMRPSKDAGERLECAVMVSVIRAVLPLVADRPPENQAAHVLDIYDCIMAERENRRLVPGGAA